MPIPLLKHSGRLIPLLLLLQASFANDLARERMRPSDCKPRDADSTCATAVAAATVAAPPDAHPDAVLYDGPLAGVPATGYAYWGFDFIADRTGTASPVRPDEFVNRSGVPVTITLSFNFPTDHPCTMDCLPGMQFQVGPGWTKSDPPFAISGNSVSITSTFQTGQGYGWVVALWQSSNPNLTVRVPKGSTATLTDVGLSAAPKIADELPLVLGFCDCADGSRASCSSGEHYSNGLLGPWYQAEDMYRRAGAFNACIVDH